jgi:hypothetical protein
MPYSTRDAEASQRQKQYDLDRQQQKEDLVNFKKTHAYMNTPDYKKAVANSRREMQALREKLENTYQENRRVQAESFAKLDKKENSIFGKISSMLRRTNNNTTTNTGGGSKSKEILGKQRRIYKVAGSRKEHVKYKGQLIPVSDYKKLMKLKR